MHSLFYISTYFVPERVAATTLFSDDWNEHLGASANGLHLAGKLTSSDNTVLGWVIVLEADSFEQAEHFLHRSPYWLAGLYSHYEISKIQIEVGRA
jgi:uncharacterized protein YciI